MKKLLIGSAILILVFVLYTSAAFAAIFGTVQATYDQASQIVTISGSISSGGGKTVCVSIKEPAGEIIYISETTSNADGSFTFRHSMQPQAAEGVYLASVGGAGVSNLVTKAFVVGDLQGKIAYLQSIKIDDTAIEGFDPDDTVYRPAVASDAQSIFITAIPEQNGAAVKINGQTAVSDSSFGPVTLYKGENDIQIEVTSQDGTNTRTYSVIVVAESGAEPTPEPTSTPTPTHGSSPVSGEPTPTATPIPSENGVINIIPTLGGDGTARSVLKNDDLANAFGQAAIDSNGVKTARIDVKAVNGASAYLQELPGGTLSSDQYSRKVEIVTPLGTVTVPDNMFSAVTLPADANVGLSIGMADTSKLSDDVKAAIGSRPVIELNAKINGQMVAWNNPDTSVTISINYSPTAEELRDPEHITVWYIDGSGKANAVTSGRYDPGTGKVTFETTHFSKYAVAFVHKTFSDISGSWAKKEIEVLASKGIIKGTSDETFSPSEKITRADFICFLVRGLGLTKTIDSNFNDIQPGDYYYNEAGIAKKLGITGGVGNNRFSPKEPILRQDMMTMTARALKVTGKLSVNSTAADIAEFTDAAEISDYAIESVAALVKEGIVKGSGKMLNPRGNASREEMAAIIYRIYSK